MLRCQFFNKADREKLTELLAKLEQHEAQAATTKSAAAEAPAAATVSDRIAASLPLRFPLHFSLCR